MPLSGLNKAGDGTYSPATLTLVNAAKELKQQNEQQQANIEEPEARLSTLEEIRVEITKIEANIGLRSSDKK